MTILDEIKNATEPFGDGEFDWRDVRGFASLLLIAATLLMTVLAYLGHGESAPPTDEPEDGAASDESSGSNSDG